MIMVDRRGSPTDFRFWILDGNPKSEIQNPKYLPQPARPGLLHGGMRQIRLEACFAEGSGARNALQPKRLDVAQFEDQVTGVIPRLARQDINFNAVETVQIDRLVFHTRQAALDNDAAIRQSIARADAGSDPHEKENQGDRDR